jgi:hypothetical protein
MGKKELIKTHVTTILLTIAVFSVGIISGMLLGDTRVGFLDININELKWDMDSVELGFMLSSAIENVSCKYLESQLSDVSEIADEIGSRIVSLETKNLLQTQSYIELKRDYMLVRLRYWLLTEQFKSECGSNLTTILYFYAVQDCPACTDQGVILDYEQSRVPWLIIFPVDAFEDISIMRTLRDVYTINVTPSIVIDGKDVYRGLQSLETIDAILCEKYNNSNFIC